MVIKAKQSSIIIHYWGGGGLTQGKAAKWSASKDEH